MRKKTLLFFTAILYVFLGYSQVLYEEKFDDEETRANWISVDADGDGYKWGLIDIGLDDDFSMASPSYYYDEENDTDVDLDPEDWLISPVIDLTNIDYKIILSFYIGALEEEYFEETYEVRIKVEETESDTAYIEDFTRILRRETLQKWSSNYFERKTINISNWAGQKIRLAFVHVGTGRQGSYLLLDNITVEKAQESADLSAEAILMPYNNGIYNMGYELPVAFRVVNKGLNAALNVQATFELEDGFSFTEDLPNIDFGESYEHTFSESIPAFDKIVYGGKIKVTVTASNSQSSSITGTFYVFPPNLQNRWDFESLEQKERFLNEFICITNDDYTLLDECAAFFPTGKSWHILENRDTSGDFPTWYWGDFAMISSGSFKESGTQADRWVILPKTRLEGSQILLSWMAATVGLGMMSSYEQYEVLISETGTNTEDFVKIRDGWEFGNLENPSRYYIDISEYAGKEIYLAFRNTSYYSVSIGPALLFIDNISFYSDVAGNSIEQNINEDIEFIVYPNPVTDILNIKSGVEIKGISIINSTGQVVYQQKIAEQGPYTINISNLPSSMYVLRIETVDGKIHIQKFIKK